MTAAIVVILIIVIVVVALVVVAPRMGGTRLGGLGRSRRPSAGDDFADPGVRRGRHRASERTLLAEGEEIQERVEAQVARDRASTEHRFRLNGRAEANRLAAQRQPPPVPGYGPTDYGTAPAYGEPGYRRPARHRPRPCRPALRRSRLPRPALGRPALRRTRIPRRARSPRPCGRRVRPPPGRPVAGRGGLGRDRVAGGRRPRPGRAVRREPDPTPARPTAGAGSGPPGPGETPRPRPRRSTDETTASCPETAPTAINFVSDRPSASRLAPAALFCLERSCN